MSGFRAYCDADNFSDAREGCEFVLSEEESRHLCGSLRARAGDEVEAFNLEGDIFECVLCSPSSKGARLKVIRRRPPEVSDKKVFLAQCLPKGKAFDDIIRRSVEIGASGVIPLMSARSEVRISESDAERKLAKWRLKVVEAVKQSANFSEFSVSKPMDFSDFITGHLSGFDLKIVASLRSGTRPLLDILLENRCAKRICALVGPEGDMTPDEYAAAESAGFVAASLGTNVMRSETAAIFILSSVKSFLSSGMRD